MANPYTGPTMTIDNMRAIGVPGLIEIPTLRRRLNCTECAGRPIDVRPDWRQHRAQGRG
jgi:hypothetical protein